MSCAKTIVAAAKEVNAIAKEISIFSVILRSLPDIHNALTSLVPQAADLRNLCKDIQEQANANVVEFENFLKDLKPLRGSRDAGPISRTTARLIWLFQKNDLVPLRSNLETSKSTLNLYINMIQARIAFANLEAARSSMRPKSEIRSLKRQV